MPGPVHVCICPQWLLAFVFPFSTSRISCFSDLVRFVAFHSEVTSTPVPAFCCDKTLKIYLDSRLQRSLTMVSWFSYNGSVGRQQEPGTEEEQRRVIILWMLGNRQRKMLGTRHNLQIHALHGPFALTIVATAFLITYSILNSSNGLIYWLCQNPHNPNTS